MLDALADSVADGVRQKHRKKGRQEGIAQDGWLIIDYGDIVVHLFSSDQRGYYDLESLWGDGRILIHLQ